MDDPRVVHRTSPGSLLQQALQMMQVYDSTRVDPTAMVQGSFQKYLTTVLLARHPEASIGQRNARELRTLAVCLDALLLGDLGLVGDCLVQRWKAVEAAIGDGHWHLARHTELIPSRDVGLATDAERAASARLELERSKLEEATKKASAKAAGSGQKSGTNAVRNS